jgi:ABC-type nitrate/sulfonate/bicarbonate transport system substrate-binding protein
MLLASSNRDGYRSRLVVTRRLPFLGRGRAWRLLLAPLALAIVVACAPATSTPVAPPSAPARAQGADASGTAGAASAPAPPAPAAIRYSQITQTALSWPFIIAGPMGLYARQGLDVDTTIGGTTANTAQALVAGAVDVAQLNVVQHILAVQKGADLALVAGNAAVPLYSLMAEPGVTSYGDLRGKAVAVAGVADPLNYVLRKMLAANGLGDADYDMVPVGGTNDRLIAVQKGAVAATLLSQPDDFHAEALGLPRLGQSTDYVDSLQYTATSVRRDWARQNQDVLVRFLRAYVEACRWFYDPANRADAIRIYVEQTHAEPDMTARTYDLYVASRKVLAQAGEVNVEGLRVLAENWQEFGLTEPAPPTERWLDLSYLEQAQRP